MIDGVIECLLLKTTEAAAINLIKNPNQSNLILCFYLVSYRKTFLMGLSFFVCEVAGVTGGFGSYNFGWQIYTGSLLIYSYFVIIQLKELKAKKEYETRIDVAFCSLALLFLYLWAIGDAYFYPKTETAFYTNYADLSVLLHVLLISSFYKPRRLLKRLGDKLRCTWRKSGYNYNCQYLLYTFRHRFANETNQ